MKMLAAIKIQRRQRNWGMVVSMIGEVRTHYEIDRIALGKFLEKKMEKGGFRLGRLPMNASVAPSAGLSRGAGLSIMLSITGIELGIWVYGLNSSRELVAVEDVAELFKLMRLYFAANIGE
jgi:aspartyl aminopeptidase